jgi:squalene-associated FAD-dependent desaturase
VAAIPRVTILGGGLAGLGAAACLAEAGFEVEILDKRPVLGGRASSFFPPGETERIDNCQHVLLGCCTNLIDFFRRTGTLGAFRFYNSFLFLGPRGASHMAASLLPEPLHLLPSLLRFKDLGWRDRWSIIRAMRSILRQGDSPPDEPLIDWLRRERQTGPAIENFWRVVLTSALNEDLERVSSRHAFQVFLDGFLKNRRGYRMGVPAIPLSDLYSSKILSERCSLRLGVNASELELEGRKIGCVRLREGGESVADYYISTVPPDALRHLLPDTLGELWPELDRLDGLDWSPITGIHLWFDRPVTSLEHAAIVGRTIQWMFNRSAIGGQAEKPSGPQYMQLVISASRSLMNMRREELLELALRELRELFPKTGQATLLKAVVVRESKATLSPQPGIDALRLGARTPFANLFLAGDWTLTGWPFTMEGAVRSGYRAAELVTEAAGQARTFLQPDLPTAPLVRFLKRF